MPASVQTRNTAGETLPRHSIRVPRNGTIVAFRLPHHEQPNRPVQNHKRQILRTAAAALGVARFERHDIIAFQGRSPGLLIEGRAQRLGRPWDVRSILWLLTELAVVQFLRRRGEMTEWCQINSLFFSGEVAVLVDFLSTPGHTLSGFPQAPARR